MTCKNFIRSFFSAFVHDEMPGEIHFVRENERINKRNNMRIAADFHSVCSL